MREKKSKFKEWLEWHVQDSKTFLRITISVLVCIVFVFLYFYQPDGRDNELEKMNIMAKCEIISISPLQTMSSSRFTGNNSNTLGYKIQYKFDVNGQKYYNSEFLKDSYKNRKLIQLANKNLLNKNEKIYIRYALGNPYKSMLCEKN